MPHPLLTNAVKKQLNSENSSVVYSKIIIIIIKKTPELSQLSTHLL